MSNKVSSYPATCYIQLGVKSSLCAYSITSCEECFIVKDETSTYESPFKVPTCILTEISTDGGHTLLDFGFLALRNYHQCRPDTKNKICLFQDFVIPTETEVTQNICITCIQCWANVEDVGPTLYKCYTDICLFTGKVDIATLL